MFIVWGTKRVDRKQGKVADFCPVCRVIQLFELVRIGMASHIYYASFGEGKLVGYVIQCLTCGVNLETDPTRYSATDKSRAPNLDVLIANTFPGVKTAYANRIALEQKLKQTPAALTSEQRRAFLMEPFGLLNPQVETRFANSTEMDKPSGLGCAVTLVVGIGGFVFTVFAIKGKTQDAALIAVGVLAGLGTIYTFVQMHLAPRRYLKSKILPVLARALEPLNPTQAEVADCVKRCKSVEMRIGKMLNPDLLWDELQHRASNLTR